MDTISIIIPAYNVEKYIRQSLDSVLRQTYRNLEIIIVDDGSKDSTGEIADEYSKKDSRIKVIHQPNQGLPTARNVGMEIATGKYIMFLDSDDFYEDNSCEVLYNEIKKHDADYVIGNYIHTTFDGTKWEKPLFDTNKYDNFKLSINDYKKSFFVMNSVVWNKIFKKKFIEKNHLRFIPRTIAEDAIFSTYCYVHTDKGYYINDVVYNYRQNQANASISTNCNMDYFINLNGAYKMIFENFNSTNTIGFYRFFYARIMPYLLCKIIDTDSLTTDEELVEVIKMLGWFFKQKEEYNVAVINKRLGKLVNSINAEDYENVVKEVKEIKQYRKSISPVEGEKMYAPSPKLFEQMSE